MGPTRTYVPRVCPTCALRVSRTGRAFIMFGAERGVIILAPSIPPTSTSPHQATYPLRCRVGVDHPHTEPRRAYYTERGATENDFLDRWNIWPSLQKKRLSEKRVDTVPRPGARRLCSYEIERDDLR